MTQQLPSMSFPDVDPDDIVMAGENYIDLNAQINLYSPDGKLQLHKDKEAARAYFRQHVNPNTVFFHDLEEKIEFLTDNNYYDKTVFDQYSWSFVKDLYKTAYSYKYRFKSFLGAYKFFNQYAMKTTDGKRYLERYEDRVVMNGLVLGDGDERKAVDITRSIMENRYQPATPTFLNAGRIQAGERVSCFLLATQDSMDSITKVVSASLQLSKMGGGVGINLSNLREAGAPIKGIENAASGVIPVMKLLEDSFSYANQLGARNGAGAVYLNACHPDILSFLDTKKENADEKVRIKTLSLGIVVPDIAFELARKNEDMYLFSPKDVQDYYGKPFSDISVTEHYYEMVENPSIKKSKVSARKLFQEIATIQYESGYPYMLFEDTANRWNNIDGRISMSNLCVSGDTELLTNDGYRRVKDLYDTQEEFKVIVDERARTMSASEWGISAQDSTKMFLTAENTEVFEVVTKGGRSLKATLWHKMYVQRNGCVFKIPLAEVRIGDDLLVNNSYTDREDKDIVDEVVNINYAGKENVYDVTVENGHSVIFNGIVTGNCSEILQVQKSSEFDSVTGEYSEVGTDISCNLGSMNISNVMRHGEIGETVHTGIDALTSVATSTSIDRVPTVKNGNDKYHSVGLGQMSLASFLASEKIIYGSKESLDFVNVYFATVRYHSLQASSRIAKERGESFHDFDKSKYKRKEGQKYSEALEKYTSGVWETHPHTERIARMFEEYGQWFPTVDDWKALDDQIQETGLYHSYVNAVAPTGSISYTTSSSASIHPVTSLIEVRKEGKIGRVYFPSPELTDDNKEYFTDAYELGYKPLIDVYACASKHVDQGLSLTLFFKSDTTTRDLNKAYIYAWSRGHSTNDNGLNVLDDPETAWLNGMVKTLYYSRIKQSSIEGTEVDCVSCSI